MMWEAEAAAEVIHTLHIRHITEESIRLQIRLLKMILTGIMTTMNMGTIQILMIILKVKAMIKECLFKIKFDF